MQVIQSYQNSGLPTGFPKDYPGAIIIEERGPWKVLVSAPMEPVVPILLSVGCVAIKSRFAQDRKRLSCGLSQATVVCNVRLACSRCLTTVEFVFGYGVEKKKTSKRLT